MRAATVLRRAGAPPRQAPRTLDLGVGTVTHTTLQMGLAVAGILAAVGLLALLAGLGMVWATWRADEWVHIPQSVDDRKEPELAGATT